MPLSLGIVQTIVVVDEMAVQQGFPVLRLPVGHCKLNPIELIWAQIRGEVAKENTTFRLADVQRLTEEAIGHVSAQNWRKASQHVCRVEEDPGRDVGRPNYQPWQKTKTLTEATMMPILILNLKKLQ